MKYIKNYLKPEQGVKFYHYVCDSAIIISTVYFLYSLIRQI